MQIRKKLIQLRESTQGQLYRFWCKSSLSWILQSNPRKKLGMSPLTLVREEMRAKFKGEASDKASSLIIAPFDSKTCQNEEK